MDIKIMRSVAGSLNSYINFRRFCSTSNKNSSTKLDENPHLPIPSTRIPLNPGKAHISNVLNLINGISFRIIRTKYSNKETFFQLQRNKKRIKLSQILFFPPIASVSHQKSWQLHFNFQISILPLRDVILCIYLDYFWTYFF